jgi:hypothetical protein
MNYNFVVALLAIFLLMIIFPLLFFFRRRVEISIENNELILQYPLTTQIIDLEKDLKHWELQETYYIRWGAFQTITLTFNNGKTMNISSLFNQTNYNTLYNYLKKNAIGKRKS